MYETFDKTLQEREIKNKWKNLYLEEIKYKNLRKNEEVSFYKSRKRKILNMKGYTTNY